MVWKINYKWLLLPCFLGLLANPLGASDTTTTPLRLVVRDPEKSLTTTTREYVNIMGVTAPDARVSVAGKEAQVFSTGIFVRDRVPLVLGENRIEVVAERGAERASTTLEIKRLEPPKPKLEPRQRLTIDAATIEPRRDVILSRGHELDVSFRGTPAQIAEFRIGDGKWHKMIEEVDSASTIPTGRYRATYIAPATGERPAQTITVRLRPAAQSPVTIIGPRVATAKASGKVSFWDEATLHLARTKNDGTALAYGLHEVRLGGPYLTELPAETLLRITGKRDGFYRVALTPTMDAWVSENDVEMLPAGTPLPHLYFTNISVGGDDFSDLVTIPYSARVPFAVSPGMGAAGRAVVTVDFYGAHHAATWISHRPTAKVIREVRVEQPATDLIRTTIELNSGQLWGYLVEATTTSLRIRIRRPPELAAPPDSPLKGLLIALEAGHGGDNFGARGVSGSKEKDINRMAVAELARQLQERGARTVLVREGDSAPTLGERARRATESSATLFISVHANSAGNERGYLAVSGTSTYYKHSFCRDLSEAIHARLLEKTGLGDFGNVGNFNYYPIRAVTWMPSMLVEQAFMSNPEDEAKMLDPEFRTRMMSAVVAGIEDWLNAQRRAMQAAETKP